MLKVSSVTTHSFIFIIIFQSQDEDFLPKTRKHLYEMDLPVHYVSRCVRTVPYTHPDTAK